MDKIIAAAKKEGELFIIGSPQTSREEYVKEFEKLYGVKVKYSGMRPSEATPKIVAEQKQDKFLSDILLEAGQNTLLSFNPIGATDDIRNYIVQSDIKDDKNWHNGFEAGFKMAGDPKQFGFAVLTYPRFYVNGDVIPEGEIKTFKDVLDPKWKGKIVINNFARPAQGATAMTSLYVTEGKEFVDKLVEQKPILVDDLRQLAESFATGKYPIGIALEGDNLKKIYTQGVIKNLKIIEPEVTTFFILTPSPY